MSSPNPPPRSACGEAGAARPGERKRSRKGGGVSRAASASAAADLGGGPRRNVRADAGRGRYTAGAREDACRDYQSSLEDLTFNSKPHINMLTILAEENLPFAKEIVSLIEAQTAKVFIHPAASYSSNTP